MAIREYGIAGIRDCGEFVAKEKGSLQMIQPYFFLKLNSKNNQ
jgi:hypothetical protein